MTLLYKLLLLAYLTNVQLAYGKIVYNTIRKRIYKSTTFIPKVLQRTCLLIPDEGPCRAGIQMYYYAPEKMNCSTFRWGGCQGNGNRFDTFEECKETCETTAGKKADIPHYCHLKFDYGFCFGEDKRFYYDDKWRVCREGIYSGCGGNKNNFYSVEACESVCRFNRGYPDEKYDGKVKINKKLIVNPDNGTTKAARTRNHRTNRATVSSPRATFSSPRATFSSPRATFSSPRATFSSPRATSRTWNVYPGSTLTINNP